MKEPCREVRVTKCATMGNRAEVAHTKAVSTLQKFETFGKFSMGIDTMAEMLYDDTIAFPDRPRHKNRAEVAQTKAVSTLQKFRTFGKFSITCRMSWKKD
jgi:hypothetical protein